MIDANKAAIEENKGAITATNSSVQAAQSRADSAYSLASSAWDIGNAASITASKNNGKITTGSYIGTGKGTDPITLTFNFLPRYVIIASSLIASSDGRSAVYYAALEVFAGSGFGRTINSTADGWNTFSVSVSGNTITAIAPSVNFTKGAYYYVAFG